MRRLAMLALLIAAPVAAQTPTCARTGSAVAIQAARDTSVTCQLKSGAVTYKVTVTPAQKVIAPLPAPTPAPVAPSSVDGEPTYSGAAGQTLVMRDNMDSYTSTTAMGAATSSTTPRITPHPSPVTNSQPVKSGSQLIAGRNGTGKALRLAYAGRFQEEQQFITLFAPRAPDQATHDVTYWARVNVSGSFQVIPVKWLELFHNKGDERIQFNTHDQNPCSGNYRTYWQVYDESRLTTCQGNQPVGPYFADLNDNQWHRYTYSYRPNSSAGARDGFARMWVDGVKVIDISAATIGVTPAGGMKPWCLADDVDALSVSNGIRDLWWGGPQTLASPAWTYDIDDLTWWWTK